MKESQRDKELKQDLFSINMYTIQKLEEAEIKLFKNLLGELLKRKPTRQDLKKVSKKFNTIVLNQYTVCYNGVAFGTIEYVNSDQGIAMKFKPLISAN